MSSSLAAYHKTAHLPCSTKTESGIQWLNLHIIDLRMHSLSQLYKSQIALCWTEKAELSRTQHAKFSSIQVTALSWFHAI